MRRFAEDDFGFGGISRKECSGGLGRNLSCDCTYTLYMYIHLTRLSLGLNY